MMLIGFAYLHQAIAEGQASAQQAYDSARQAEHEAALNKALVDAIESAQYGAGAIDVEVREVPDTPLLEQKP